MSQFIPVLSDLLGAGLVGNGIFMLASPETWYFTVPGVTSTGPFNQHFLRDIGLIFVLIGSGFLYGAARPGSRVLLWSMGAIWLSALSVAERTTTCVPQHQGRDTDSHARSCYCSLRSAKISRYTTLRG